MGFVSIWIAEVRFCVLKIASLCLAPVCFEHACARSRPPTLAHPHSPSLTLTRPCSPLHALARTRLPLHTVLIAVHLASNPPVQLLAPTARSDRSIALAYSPATAHTRSPACSPLLAVLARSVVLAYACSLRSDCLCVLALLCACACWCSAKQVKTPL